MVQLFDDSGETGNGDISDCAWRAARLSPMSAPSLIPEPHAANTVSPTICPVWCLVLAVAMLLFAGPASGLAPDKAFHQYVMNTWSIEEGLPQITVTDIVQGPEGYIWAATQAGVARFDGVRFSNFDPLNTPELPGTLTQTLFVDSQDRLWIGTYKGVALYKQRSFHAIALPGGPDSSVDVFGFAEREDGRILAATSDGLMTVDESRLRHAPNAPDAALRAVAWADGGLWLGGRGVVFEQQADGWKAHPLSGRFSSAWVNGFTVYDDRLWAATDAGLLQLKDGEWQASGVDAELDRGVIEALYPDRDGNLWVSTASALFRVHGDRVGERIPDEADYAHGGVLAITEDREGNLWLGSRWYGIARLWNGWVFRYSEVEGLHNPLVWSVARGPEGDLWVGTMDGLSRFRDGRFELVVGGDEQPHPHAYTLLPERSRIWIGTRAGLVWWDREARRLNTPDVFDRLAGIQVNGIIRVRDGTYWIATTSGIWHWEDDSLHQHLAERSIRLLMETSDGVLYAGSQEGLFRMSPDNTFERVESIPIESDVTALAELSDGRLAAGTLGEKLFLQTRNGWRGFDASDGLPANSPFAIADHEGMLWVGGIRGIFRVPLDAFDEYLGGEIDSLPGRMILHERGDISGAQKGYCCNGAGNAKGFMEDGEFWLPSRGGVVHLAPDRIHFNQRVPEVLIERFRLNDDWHSLGPGEDLELPADERDIAFGFTALSFQDPGSVQLEYRLLGFSDEWRTVDDIFRRTAFFTNLPSGEFRLQVRGSNNAGVWSDVPAEQTLSIPPFFYETIWFKLIIALFAIVVIWLGYRFQLRSLRAHRQRLESTVSERTEELRVANEHLVEYSKRLEEASHTDPLTGLWNRRYLVDQLPKDLSHFRRLVQRKGHEDEVMVFALIDLDHFKRINDTHGHGAGDLMLQQFAEILKQQVREGDYVVRWGGEEFLIVFRPMPVEQPPRVAERIRGAVASAEFDIHESHPIHLTCSIGFAEYPAFRAQPSAMDWEEIVELADQALYYVKENGRDGWCIFRPTEAIQPGTLRTELEQGMERLIDAGHISIVTSVDRSGK